MDPSDHDERDIVNGPSGGHGPTHDNGAPPGDGGWLRSVLENSDEVVKVLDPDGTLRYASPAFGRVFGYDPEEVVGKMNVLGYVHPEDLPHVLEETEKALSEGGAASNRTEYRFRHKDGSWRWVEGVGTYLPDDPQVGGVVVNARDVTERKRAEGSLREAEERYRTLVERVPAMAYVHRQVPGGFSGTTYVSPQVETILGYTPEEYTSEPEFWKSVVHPEDRERVLADDERTGGTGEPFDLDFRMISKEGRAVWLRESGALVRTEDDGTQVWHGVMFDITELKRTEVALREAEERYRTLVEQIPAVTYIDRADGSFEALYTSPQIEGLLGYTPEEWIEGRLWEERLHPDDRGRILAADELLEVHGEPFAEEYRLLAKDGSVVWVREGAVLVRDGEGEPLFWQGVIFDLTERRNTEEALRRSEALLAESQRIAHLGTWEWDVATGDVWWSEETYRIHGLEPGGEVDLRGRVEEAFLPEDLPLYRRKIGETLSGVVEGYDHEHRLRRADGEVRWVHAQAEVVRGEKGNPLRMVGTVHDVTERRDLEDRLRHQALHDPLTGLPNRSLFMDRLKRAMARAGGWRRGRVAVLFMDLDDFKVVNDSLGHGIGDDLLIGVARRLGRCVRPGDTLARFGGDEFVLLLEDVGGHEEAVRVAKRIVDELGDPFVLSGQKLYARAGIGIAVGGAHTGTPEGLLRDADTAMYRAKEGGAGYSLFDPSMHQRALGRLERENDLRRAIEQGEFVVHYQPIVRLDGGAVWGVEALVRWQHPERGLLNPDEFVPAAEESGLVVPMGAAVLEEACRRAKGWQEAHPKMPPLIVYVNLSARQLARPDLAEAVEGALRRTGFDGSCLGLDVTETVYVKALEGDTKELGRLRALGVRVSIDDFGTGYSSLSYLKRLPADALKMDKTFVRGIGEDVEDTAIVRMVVELAHTLGMEVVAEGVETEGQAEVLREMGCDLGQGYHFSRPVPPEDVPGFLRT